MIALSKIKRIFFPETCPFCREIIPLSQNSCNCLSDAFFIGRDYCPHCGSTKDECSCGRENAVYLDNVCGVFIYSGRVRKALHRFKFNRELKTGEFFGDKMSLRAAECFPDIDFDLVCCAPMHKQDKKERGYNQSELLARRVSKKLFIPFEDCLVKTNKTQRQHTLTAKERNTNLVGTIKVKNGCDIKGKTILLCDDIKTTGSTLFECEKVLKEKGARRVYCLCCAVSHFNRDNIT